jgi:hypothetical protein
LSAATIARVPFGVVAERMPQRTAVGDQFGKLLFEFLEGVGFVEAEGLARGVGAVAETVPDFALLVLLAAEEDAARGFACRRSERSRLRVRESR